MTTQKRTTQVITKTQKTKNHTTPWERAKNARANATGARIKPKGHHFFGISLTPLSSIPRDEMHPDDRKTQRDPDPSVLAPSSCAVS
jgi:hypothetical protein